jgi:hypothetical protein
MVPFYYETIEKIIQLPNQLPMIIVIFLIPLKKLYYMKNVLLLLSIVLIFIGCSTNNNGTVTVVPIAPTNLTGTVISTSQVNLSWTDNATNEDGFKIERKSGSGSYALVGSMGSNLITFSDLGLTPNTTYTYRVYAYNSAGNSLQYSNEVIVTTQDNIPSWLTNGLVAYYPFNGNADDSSGNGNNGTVYGATSTSDRFGVFNKAYNFDGDQDYILIPNSVSLNPNAITFSIWAYFNNGNCGILSKSDATTNNNYGYSIIYNFQNQNSGLFTGWNTSGSCTYPTPNEGYTFGSSGIIQISTWQHILISINEQGECKQYINGIQTYTYNHIPLNTCNSNLSLLHIGRQWLGDPCWMNGKIDDIRIYNRALSQSEVTYIATH